jgi:peptidoglycan/LPS O-acetylase OafA/YrhL
MTMKSPAKHVEFLDHLRGVAILAVLLFHTLGLVFGYDVLPWRGWFRDFSAAESFWYFLPLSIGNIGVPIFFVVSGFCIHLSFQSQGKQWGNFISRRIFRIYPAYLVALLFFTVLYGQYFRLDSSSQVLWTQLLSHLFLVHNFQNATIGGINGSFWSIAIEAQLYLLYPALLWLVAKLGWRRTLGLLAGMEILIRGTWGLVDTLETTDTLLKAIAWKLAVSPLGYWFSWSLGAWLAEAHLKQQPLPFAKTSPLWWVGLASLSYFVKPLDSFRFLIFAVATAVTIRQFLGEAEPKFTAPKAALALLKKIGLWSYSLYLIHQPLLQIYAYALNWAVPAETRSVPVAWLLNVTAWLPIMVFSILLYELIELPGIAWGKRLIQPANLGEDSRVAAERSSPPIQAASRTGRLGLKLIALLLFVGGTFWINASLVPRAPGANNNLAWSLATNADAAKRNGALAVTLAEDACQRTHYAETIYLGTLAAAYAETGRFDEAIATAQRACELATKNWETKLLARNQELLERYRQHEPARE